MYPIGSISEIPEGTVVHIRNGVAGIPSGKYWVSNGGGVPDTRIVDGWNIKLRSYGDYNPCPWSLNLYNSDIMNGNVIFECDDPWQAKRKSRTPGSQIATYNEIHRSFSAGALHGAVQAFPPVYDDNWGSPTNKDEGAVKPNGLTVIGEIDLTLLI